MNIFPVGTVSKTEDKRHGKKVNQCCVGQRRNCL